MLERALGCKQGRQRLATYYFLAIPPKFLNAEVSQRVIKRSDQSSPDLYRSLFMILPAAHKRSLYFTWRSRSYGSSRHWTWVVNDLWRLCFALLSKERKPCALDSVCLGITLPATKRFAIRALTFLIYLLWGCLTAAVCCWFSFICSRLWWISWESAGLWKQKMKPTSLPSALGYSMWIRTQWE